MKHRRIYEAYFLVWVIILGMIYALGTSVTCITPADSEYDREAIADGLIQQCH